jgi:hypothetical protein
MATTSAFLRTVRQALARPSVWKATLTSRVPPQPLHNLHNLQPLQSLQNERIAQRLVCMFPAFLHCVGLFNVCLCLWLWRVCACTRVHACLRVYVCVFVCIHLQASTPARSAAYLSRL